MMNKNSSVSKRQRIWAALLLAFAFMLAQPDKAKAQCPCPWITNGNNINNTNPGNVGIGTTTPGSKLEVIGNIALSDSSRITAKSDFGNYVMPYTSFGRMAFGTAGIDRVSILYNGNVGVGTTTPIVKLTVVGEILAEGPIASLSFRDRTSSTGWAWVSTGDVARLWNTGFGDLIGITATGRMGIGTTAPSSKLHVVGDVTLTGTGSISASGTITAGNIVAKYQDIAEWVPSRRVMPAGTVVVLDTVQLHHVLASSQAYDTRVAGVVSERPGLILGEGGDGKLMVATTGRVRVKADATRAPIHAGDILVTSDREGIAMRSEPIDLGGAKIHRPGTIIGKALEPLDKGTGEILVLLSLQ